MPNEKARQRDRLIMEFGILIQPYEELVSKTPPPPHSEYRKAIAKVQGGEDSWTTSVREFATLSQDVVFRSECRAISILPDEFRTMLRIRMETPPTGDLVKLQSDFSSMLESQKVKFFRELQTIPVEWEPELFEANTPFTSYLRIKEAIAVVKHTSGLL